jgi:alpha-D-ribose 1-methylphosphonate 5-triphosphate synthase subunit PhnH
MTIVPTLTPRAAREQRTFRVLLDAMARPGCIGRLPEDGEIQPVLAVAEALVDHEVTFAALPDSPELTDAVLRLTGSRLASLDAADYVFCDATTLAETLLRVKEGTSEYPDRSATVVCRVQELQEAGPDCVLLSGPGVNGSKQVFVADFDAAARAAFAERNAMPPTGVDVIFISRTGQVACLSRYTRLKVED